MILFNDFIYSVIPFIQLTDYRSNINVLILRTKY
jgi:hypothetical protein